MLEPSEHAERKPIHLRVLNFLQNLQYRSTSNDLLNLVIPPLHGKHNGDGYSRGQYLELNHFQEVLECLPQSLPLEVFDFEQGLSLSD